MSKLIQIYRHQESIKDPVRGKIPTLEGIANSYGAGYKTSQEYKGAEVRGYHSSALRTEMALDAYIMGAGKGSKRRLSCLEEMNTPSEFKKLRKQLGDDGSMRVRLENYGKDDLETSVSYYTELKERARSIVDMIKGEIEDALANPDKKEIVVCYSHEPTLAVSIIELAKEYLGYDGKSNAEFFKEITGSGKHYFVEGTGYAIEVREENGQTKVYLITEKGEVELKVKNKKSKKSNNSEEGKSEESSEESGSDESAEE